MEEKHRSKLPIFQETTEENFLKSKERDAPSKCKKHTECQIHKGRKEPHRTNKNKTIKVQKKNRC